jgi:site-specific recombinase XerD
MSPVTAPGVSSDSNATAGPSLSAADHEILESFLDALWIERGLTSATLSAYRSDLTALGIWLAARNRNLVSAGRDDLLSDLAERVGQGMKARSSARVLSSVRRLYRHLLLTAGVDVDPSYGIESPKLGRPLPKSLTETEVDALFAAPNTGCPLGVRDRAMLELMYASGLRVSELVALALPRINLGQGVVRVLGKGGKERLVPLGEEASAWVERYLRGLIRHPAWGGDDSPGVLVPDQALCGRRRYPRAVVSAYLAPRLRDAPSQSWRRSTGVAVTPRTQRLIDDPDLYACRPRTPQGAACAPPPARLVAGDSARIPERMQRDLQGNIIVARCYDSVDGQAAIASKRS